MPQVEVGMAVMVDMAGFESGGVSMGPGASAGGTVTAIDLTTRHVTVKLNAVIGGVETITVPADKLSAVQ